MLLSRSAWPRRSRRSRRRSWRTPTRATPASRRPSTTRGARQAGLLAARGGRRRGRLGLDREDRRRRGPAPRPSGAAAWSRRRAPAGAGGPSTRPARSRVADAVAQAGVQTFEIAVVIGAAMLAAAGTLGANFLRDRRRRATAAEGRRAGPSSGPQELGARLRGAAGPGPARAGPGLGRGPASALARAGRRWSWSPADAQGLVLRGRAEDEGALEARSSRAPARAPARPWRRRRRSAPRRWRPSPRTRRRRPRAAARSCRPPARPSRSGARRRSRSSTVLARRRRRSRAPRHDIGGGSKIAGPGARNQSPEERIAADLAPPCREVVDHQAERRRRQPRRSLDAVAV